MMLLRDNVMIIRNDGWILQEDTHSLKSGPGPDEDNKSNKNNKILILSQPLSPINPMMNLAPSELSIQPLVKLRLGKTE